MSLDRILFTLIFSVLALIFVRILLRTPKSYKYEIQADGKSAQIREISLCLVDSQGHRIWVSLTSSGPLVTTVHDFIPVKGSSQIWANNHELQFTHDPGKTIVHWGEDLEVSI